MEKLGAYLAKRTEEFAGQTIVVDVGAGDGLLAESLRQFFDAPVAPKRQQRVGRPNPQNRPSAANRKTPTIVAIDDGSWSIAQKAPVEDIGVEKAIDKYTGDDAKWQVVILCSWMPMNQDWTAMFRRAGVDEYILIGECDDGQCGDNWETWGNREFLSDLEAELSGAPDDPSPAQRPKPFEKDGYKRSDLDTLALYQFSRFDCKVSKTGRTVSFRRQHR